MSFEVTQTHTLLKTPLAAKVSKIILRGMMLFSVLAIFLTAAIEYKLYKETAERNLDNLRESIKQRLAAVGETTVTFLDREKHDAVFDFWDFQLEDFQHVKNQLLQVQKSNQLKEALYTLRLEDEEKRIAKFVAMTDLSQGKPYIGVEYVFPKEMLRAFKKGETVYTDIYVSKSVEGGRWMSVFVPFEEPSSDDFAVLEVDISLENLLLEVESKNRQLMLVHLSIAIGLLLVFIALYFLMQRLIHRTLLSEVNLPLATFMNHIDQIQKGSEVQKLQINTGCELEVLAEHFSAMYSTIQEKQQELSNLNLSLEDKVKEQTASIRNLLDNAGQGFLSFGPDYLILPGYSRECINLLGTELGSNVDVSTLLFADSGEIQEFKEWMDKGFDEDFDFDLVNELAPKEFEIEDRFLEVQYRRIVSRDSLLVMMILTDVTEKKELQNMAAREENLMKRILRTLQYPDQFTDFVKEYEDYEGYLESSGILDQMDGKLESEQLGTLFRLAHTIKGNAGSFEFEAIVDAFHELESQLQDLKDGKENEDCDLMTMLQNCSEAYSSTMQELRTTLGDSLDWEEKRVRIPEREFKNLLEQIKSSHPQVYENFVPYVQKKFCELMTQYELLVDELSMRLEKLVKPMKIEGGEFFVDHNDYSRVVGTMVHVFRNSVDHGIESPEIREEMGKDPEGTIECKIYKSEDVITILVQDDGGGIHPQRLRSVLQQKGIYEEEELENLTDQQVIESIFLPSFSSREEVSDTSGRGVGLDALKVALEEMGGTITVSSEIDAGTRFEMKLPLLS